MDKDVVMYLIGGVFAVAFFVWLPVLLVILSRNDFRAEDTEHLGPDDFGEKDFENMTGVVEAAIVDFSVKRIDQSELSEVLRKARTT